MSLITVFVIMWSITGCVSWDVSWFIYSGYHIVLEHTTQELKLSFPIRFLVQYVNIRESPAKVMFFNVLSFVESNVHWTFQILSYHHLDAYALH